jgi:hypothetical protein
LLSKVNFMFINTCATRYSHELVERKTPWF